jgi:hypothetical protein
VGASGTLKAIATATGYTASAVGSATYTINTGGGGIDYPTLCQGSLTQAKDLLTTCLHWNPDYVNAIMTSGVFECTDIGKEITAGRVVYSPTQAAACAAALGAVTCALFSSPTPAACDLVLTGTVANGGSCYLDVDCSTGWCNSTASTCPGTCQAFAQLGGSCATVSCGPGLTCDGTPRTCKAESAASGPCPCQAGLWCDDAVSPGTCKVPQTSGACATSNAGQCAIGYACVGTPSTTCQSTVGLGGDCTASDTLCGLGYSCDAATHKCVSWPKLGEACGSSSSNMMCIASYCDVVVTNVCVAYKQVGAPCTYPIDIMACEPGSTCDAATSTCKASATMTCQVP